MHISFEMGFTILGIIFLIIALSCLIGLIYQLKAEPRTLKIGILAESFFVSLFFSLQFIFFVTKIRTFAIRSEIIILTLIFAIFPFIFAWYILYQLIKVWYREAHTLSNLLLTLAVFVYIVLLVLFGVINQKLPLWGKRILMFMPLSMAYLTFTFLNFFLSSYIYGLKMHFKRKLPTQWLVTLGAGLINGNQVGKLLASRIDVTINQAKRNDNLTEKETMIIFSGGQGIKETTSEAQAMFDYARKKNHWPLAKSRLETRSRNTRENLLYSAQLLAQEKQKVEFTFCTSDYHVFRAALLSKRLGIAANGIGSKTPIYYRGTAFLREYIAILVMNKKRHIIVAFIFILISILSAIYSAFTY